MTRAKQLLAEIQALLPTLDTSYSDSSAANDLYEGFVFSILVRAAESAGGDVRYLNQEEAAATELVFRTSPGMIHSTKHDYTHAEITFPDCPPLEAHIGIRVEGRSGVLHECDVLVLPRSEARAARSRKVAPRGSTILIAVECKYYTSPIGIALGREFQGLHADASTKEPRFVSNLCSKNVERYLTHLGREWNSLVVPSSVPASDLESAFRRSFSRYKASQFK